MTEKILITGGAGYIGCVLTEYLLNAGYQVTALDNLHYGQKPLLHLSSCENFSFVYGDVRDELLLRRIVPQFEVIIPLAAIVGAPACDNQKHEAQTINHDAIILLNRVRRPEQKIIFPTSNSGYGIKSSPEYCTEDTPLEPISLYGRTKVNAEKVLLASPNVITLRLATVFGASSRMRTDLLVNHFVQKALFEGILVLFEKSYKRNYIHIRDVARCFEHCIVNFELMKNNAYNVGLEEANLSKEELAQRIKQHLPGLILVDEEFKRDPDQRNYLVSNKKLYSTGFKPKYSLDFGIKELIKAYGIIGNTNLSNV